MNFLWCLFKHPDACKCFFSPTTGVCWHAIITNAGTCLLYPRYNFFLCSVAVTVWVAQSCTVLGEMHVSFQAQGNTSSKSETEGKNGFSVLHVPHEPCRRQVVRAGGSPEVAALAKLVFPGSS